MARCDCIPRDQIEEMLACGREGGTTVQDIKSWPGIKGPGKGGGGTEVGDGSALYRNSLKI